jgi:hypothetical protein
VIHALTGFTGDYNSLKMVNNGSTEM